VGFELKKPNMSTQDSIFARTFPKSLSPPLLSAVGGGERRLNDLLASLFAFFRGRHTYSIHLSESKFRAGRLSFDPAEQLQGELGGGSSLPSLDDFHLRLPAIEREPNKIFCIGVDHA
jgi:hypothetical protein